MSDVLNDYLTNLLEERKTVLLSTKKRLEEQMTDNTGGEIELPEQFADQRKEKLADTIKELKTIEWLEDYYIVIRKKENTL